MLAIQHSHRLASAMGLGQIPNIPVPEVPGVIKEIPGAVTSGVDEIVKGVKSLSTDVNLLIDTIRDFRFRTEHDVRVTMPPLKIELPPPGSILRAVLPPILITTAAIVGTAFAFNWALRYRREHTPRLVKS